MVAAQGIISLRMFPILFCLFLRVVNGYTPANNAALGTAVKDWCTNAVSAESTYGQHISNWNTSSITSMVDLFCSDATSNDSCLHGNQGCDNFNEDISSWDVSQVANMMGMFYYASAFNQDVSSWDVSQVTTMEWMFGYAGSFNQDISSWDVSQVTNMDSMFYNANDFRQTICWKLNPSVSMVDVVDGTLSASVNHEDSTTCEVKSSPYGTVIGILLGIAATVISVWYYFPRTRPWNTAPDEGAVYVGTVRTNSRTVSVYLSLLSLSVCACLCVCVYFSRAVTNSTYLATIITTLRWPWTQKKSKWKCADVPVIHVLAPPRGLTKKHRQSLVHQILPL
jgi:surface protein